VVEFDARVCAANVPAAIASSKARWASVAVQPADRDQPELSLSAGERVLAGDRLPVVQTSRFGT